MVGCIEQMAQRLNGQMAIVIGGCMAKVTHLTVGLTKSIVHQNNAHCCYSSGRLRRWKRVLREYYEIGDREWQCTNGQRHREDGPAVEYADGSRAWFLHGQLHRETGPALEYTNSDCFWYLNGRCHRADGPAVEWADGSCFWFLHGIRYSFRDWLDNLNPPPETRTLLIIKWSR